MCVCSVAARPLQAAQAKTNLIMSCMSLLQILFIDTFHLSLTVAELFTKIDFTGIMTPLAERIFWS